MIIVMGAEKTLFERLKGIYVVICKEEWLPLPYSVYNG
jgi:hypothetical protein